MDRLAAYWITVAHLPKWSNNKINSLIKEIIVEKNSDLEEFFSLYQTQWRVLFNLDTEDIEILSRAKEQIPNNSFLAETLYNQGYEIIPITSEHYSKSLKQNLRLRYSPPVLYVKGNKQIMKEKSVAVVGSRNASSLSLQFTDKIVRNATKQYRVIVSGFAKGVDKAALDSALKYHGQSIIVLPQGIMTFGSGFKKYYKQIIEGDILVLSTFHPKVPWRADLAMARNPIIYGLADKIYVAESSNKGGTWSGVNDGLRKEREIYVRNPEPGENSANRLLIEMGATAVDIEGNLLYKDTSEKFHKPGIIAESNISVEIMKAISKRTMTAKEICKAIKPDWTAQKMSQLLKKLDKIKVIKKGKVNRYRAIDTFEDQQLKVLDI